MKKLLSDKAFLIELIGFVFLQIFVDIYRTFFETSIQIFGIALPEFINIFYLLFLTAVFFLKNLKKPKVLIPVIIYSVLVAVYLVLHIMNIFRFGQDIFTGSELNWFKEVYYIIRTNLIPIYVFYYFICSSLTVRTFEKTISILSLIVSLNIILTNIFKVSFICYASGLEKNSLITRNIFEWFYNPDTEFPIYMTSKGWFYMGNQIGLILFILFVFVLMQAFKHGTIFRYLVAFLNGIAMLMVGTKVSAIGCCIVLGIGFVFAIVFGVILKQFVFNFKSFIIYLSISAIIVTVFLSSPMFSVQASRNEAYIVNEEQKEVTESLAQKFEEEKIDLEDKDNKKRAEFIKEFSAYVNRSPYFFGIEPEFLELFPIKENFDFWYKIVINGNNRQLDYRFLKSAIYSEAIQKNDNKVLDKLFGIGYVSGFLYSEQDFISQNIWFGYFGTALLIGPYILVALYSVFLAFKRIRSCFVYQNAFFALGICAPLLFSFIAGHLFYGIFSIIIFAFVVAGFYKFQTEGSN